MVLPHRSEWPHAENVWNTSTLSKGETSWHKKSFPHSHLPSHCLHSSAGKTAEGKQLERCQHLGLLAALCSRGLGSFCIPLLWSCQQVKHSAVFLRAAETWCALPPPLAELAWPCLAPCLGWARFNPLGSPDGSPQAWSGLRSCPLIFSKREKCPPAACNCWDTKHGFCLREWTFNSRDRQTQQHLISTFWLSGQRPEHLQVSTPSLHRVCWDGGCMC